MGRAFFVFAAVGVGVSLWRMKWDMLMGNPGGVVMVANGEEQAMRKMRVAVSVMAVMVLAAGARGADDAPSVAKRPDAFFTTEAGRAAVDHVVSWQGHGPGAVMGWPKAYSTAVAWPNDPTNPAQKKIEWNSIATIDNGATHSELRILGRAVTLNPDLDPARLGRWKASFDKGLDALCAVQYANGGWAQRFPVDAPGQAAYAPRITFNDNAMTDVLVELKAIAAGEPPYAWVDAEHRAKAKAAFDKGITCILDCQIKVDGVLTGWCAQHDEKTLAPAAGRAFEPASISGGESANIALLLMSIEKPNDRVKAAIDAVAAWYEKVKIVDKKSEGVTGADGKRDRALVDSPGAVTWARFYDVKTEKPIFEGRDSVIHDSMADIERERRTGYSWYGPWGGNVERIYAKWKKAHQ